MKAIDGLTDLDTLNESQMWALPTTRLARLLNLWTEIVRTEGWEPSRVMGVRLRAVREERVEPIGNGLVASVEGWEPTALTAFVPDRTVCSPGMSPVRGDECACEHGGHRPACAGKIRKVVKGIDGRKLGYCTMCLKASHDLLDPTEWEEKR